MARSRTELHSILKGLDGVVDAYFQAPTSGMQYPCIKYQAGLDNNSKWADNLKYLLKKGYTVTVIDRNPDSLIPDQVEGLPYTRYDRFYVVDGLNHFVFQMFF